MDKAEVKEIVMEMVATGEITSVVQGGNHYALNDKVDNMGYRFDDGMKTIIEHNERMKQNDKAKQHGWWKRWLKNTT